PDAAPPALAVRLACRAAMTPPPGPARLEIPPNILYHHDDAAKQHRGARVYAPAELRSAGDPAAVERALEALARAERPLIVAGDGVVWSAAAAELGELARRLRPPG